MNEILTLSGTRQGELIREGKISSEELVRAHLERIDEINPRLNAAIEVLRDEALEAARGADGRRAKGELLSSIDGVPFSVKDSIEVQGTVCTAGTLGYRDAPRSTCDATLVGRLRAAGAIPIARTNVPDLLFAFESDNLIYGRTNNPYALDRTPGGSSGGEAALIAACGSPFGLGSDAAGSVRLPAHFCGIASLKPTSGRLARTGHVPPAGGWIELLWQIGPMARRLEDLESMMPILLGPNGIDHTVVPMPYGSPPEAPRIAFFIDNGIAAPDEETVDTVRRAAGAIGAEERRPPCVERSYDLEMKILGPDGGDGLREFLKSIRSSRTHGLLDGWLGKLEAYRTDAAGFAAYGAGLFKFRASLGEFMREYDAILSPVCATPALLHGTSVEEGNFRGFSYTMTHNLTGWPAGVVRCGTSAAGLPIGVQVAARPWREDVVIAVLRRLEEACGGWGMPSGVA